MANVDRSDTRSNGDRDQREAKTIVVAMTLLAVLACVGVILLIPALQGVVAQQFSPGVGLKTSAVIAFFVTIALFVTFAVVAGDGLIGELQFMLAGFFGFFVICWLMIAWIF